jgi:hypothetical protein
VARIIIDIPDEYVDWSRWVQDNLAKGGLPNTQIAQTTNGVPDTRVEPTVTVNPLQGGSESPPTDPWAAAGAASATTQAATPSATAAAPASGATPTGPNRVVKDVNGKEYVYQLHLNNAPTCLCGDIAARLTAPKKAGGTFTKWVCAKDCGSDWKGKCDFSQWN